MEDIPRVHEVNEAAGITEEVARKLDRAMAEMERPDKASFDPSGETLAHLRPAELGTSSHSLRRGTTTNEQILFSTLVQRGKNKDPDIEHDEAYDRAAAKFEELVGENEEDG